MELENYKFLEKFEDVEILDGGNSSEGKPTLIYAKYHGIEKFIKYWEKKQNSLSPELELLWLDEIRQLQRLNGYPNPENHIAYLDHSAKDDSGFYLVLETDGRLPLPYTNSKWLASVLQNEDHRLKFWKNIIRIVRAIDFLHSQGLLHRNIDRFSVLTGDDTNNNNFQLSGFEWSIRIQTFKAGRSIVSRSSTINEKMYSFSNDWYGLGILILDLLNIPYASISDASQSASSISHNINLSIREISLIRALLGIVKIESSISYEAISGQIIEEYIDSKIIKFIDKKERDPFDIIFAFAAHPSDSTAGLRAKVGLYTAISDKYRPIQISIPNIEDVTSLIELVRIDLSEKPVLFLLNSQTEEHFLLKGKHLIYLLEPNKISRNADKTWDTAFCKSAFREMPESLKNNEYIFLDSQSIKVWPNINRGQTLSFRSWEFFLEKLSLDRVKKNVEQQELIDGLIAFHLTEMAYARTEIFPVTVLGMQDSIDNPGHKLLKLSSCQNARLEDLGQIFDLEPSAKRLKQSLEGDIYDSGWILTAKDNFQDDDENVELTYLEFKPENGKDTFTFLLKDNISIENNNLFIIPSSSEGTIRQLNRRARALELLDKHIPLINTLLDPHRQFQNSAEAHLIQNINEHLDKLNISLDDSKKTAFKHAIHTLPLYLVQGPPGVGKTYLATAIIKHIFSQGSESRVLITAQSHSTVEHIFQEVNKGIEENLKPLIVKCIKSSQPNGSDTKAALDEQARELLIGLMNSEAFLESQNELIKSKIASSANIDERWQRYSLMNHLLRSANLVFTTTNSRYIEDMLINRAQFDWSIMEEAGKVTGIELISPLLLSHRKLMIGDHLQLPPHRSKEIQRILNNPEKLHSAIQSAIDGKKRPVKGDSTGARIEELRKIGLDKAIILKKIGSSAAKTHLLFEMLIKIEEDRAVRISDMGLQSNHKPIASMLTEQYRMHPLIAEIISDVFYNSDKGKSLRKLTSSKSTIEFFHENERPFFWQKHDALNEFKPIVWINTPDVMEKQYATTFKDEPRWTNDKECEAIITILKSLRSQKNLKTNPKLAILTAYSSQKIMIEKEIRNELSGELSHLASFSKPDDHESFCSTIHSFQGAEADLVILSMVRNNIKDTARGAFGFFLDEQLFNVMLSRARFQLIIVGSFNFYKRWIGKNEFINNSEYHFLIDFVKKLEILRDREDITIIDFKE